MLGFLYPPTFLSETSKHPYGSKGLENHEKP
jgi:hypothetical protein